MQRHYELREGGEISHSVFFLGLFLRTAERDFPSLLNNETSTSSFRMLDGKLNKKLSIFTPNARDKAN